MRNKSGRQESNDDLGTWGGWTQIIDYYHENFIIDFFVCFWYLIAYRT